jgi:hypothetical protein
VNSFSTINNAGAPSAGMSSTTDLKPASHPLLPLIDGEGAGASGVILETSVTIWGRFGG